MAIFPCDNKAFCVDPSTPFQNFTAEAPDRHISVARSTGFGPEYPPLGTDFLAVGCVTFCESTVSQEEADLCAARQNVDCLSVGWPVFDPGVDVFGNPVPVPRNRPVFRNREQSASVQCPDGSPFTFIVPAGRYEAFSQAQADQAAQSEAQRLAQINLLCLGNLTVTQVCANDAYAASVSATGNFLTDANACWQVFGSLPPGINSDLDLGFGGCQTGSTTLNFFGTPTAPGDYSFSVQIEDGSGNFMVKTFVIRVKGVTNAGSLPGGTVGTPYSFDLESFGFTNPIYSVEAGALPDGLTLSTAGTISGTPTVADTFAFIVGITEAGTGVVACVSVLEIVVAQMSNCSLAPSVLDNFLNPGGFVATTSYQRPSGNFLLTVDTSADIQLDSWDVSGPLAVHHDSITLLNTSGGSGQMADYCASTSQWVVGLTNTITGHLNLHLIEQFPITFNLKDAFTIDLGVGSTGFQSLIVDSTTKIAYVLTDGVLYSVDLVAKVVVATVNLPNGVNLTLDNVALMMNCS